MYKYYNHLGFMNPYFAIDNNGLSIDLSFKQIVSKINLKQINITSIIEIISHFHIFGDSTLIKGVYKSPWMAKPNSKKTDWEFAELPNHGNSIIGEEEISKGLFSRLQKEIINYCNDKSTIGLLLSGGMDSRITAIALQKLMKDKILDINVVAITWGVDNSRDVEYASKIAQKFGWDWLYLKLSPDDLLNNIIVTAERGCEYSPIHLHGMPQVRDLDGLDAIIASSFGDSVGRAEFSGMHLMNLKPVDYNISNWFKFILSEPFDASRGSITQDLERYHKNFPRKNQIEYFEIDQQAHYMRRMLNPCLSLINERIPLFQVFSDPFVFGYMWALSPKVRNDKIYLNILNQTKTEIADIPWAKTGMKYPIRSGKPDDLEKLTIPYGSWIRNEILNTIEQKVFNGKLEKLNIFNFDALEIGFNLNKNIFNGKRATRLDEIFIWLAALSDFVDIYQVDCYEDNKTMQDSINGKLLSPAILMAFIGKNYFRR